MKSTIANHFRIYPAAFRHTQPAAAAALSQTTGRRRFTVADVEAFEDDAYSWLTKTISEMGGNRRRRYGQNKIREYFGRRRRGGTIAGSSEETKVMTILNEINSEMRHMQIVLATSSERLCQGKLCNEACDAGAVAYMLSNERGTGVTYFCPLWDEMDDDFKTKNLIHEMAHHASSTMSDYAYHQDPVEELSKDSPALALDNADSYALMAKDIGSRRRRRGSGGCFPGTAKVMTKDQGWRQLRDLKGGELIATSDMSTKEVKFEQFLADLHSEEEHKQVMNYIRLEHEFGSLEVSAWHFVNTAEHGILPAGHIHNGEHLMATDGSSLKKSKVLSVGNVSKVGLYSPLMFSGTVLVDGVLVSSYTADEFHAFLDKNAQEQLLKYVRDFNGINSIMHWLALPLRLSYYIGLPSLLQSASAWGIPGSSHLLRFLVPDQKNAFGNTLEDGQAAYVELMGRWVGGLINGMASRS
jgi:hypothetical protein